MLRVRKAVVAQSLSLFVLGCGAPAATKEAAPPPPAAAVGPRCAPSEPSQPPNLREIMKQGGGNVKGCFLLGKASSTPPSMRVSLRVGAAGAVKSLSSSVPGAEASQIACAESVLKKLSFAPFCGEEVEVSWTYALGS